MVHNYSYICAQRVSHFSASLYKLPKNVHSTIVLLNELNSNPSHRHEISGFFGHVEVATLF